MASLPKSSWRPTKYFSDQTDFGSAWLYLLACFLLLCQIHQKWILWKWFQFDWAHSSRPKNWSVILKWRDWKYTRTYTERKIPWISLFRIILYSYIIRFYRSWHWNKRVCWKQWFSFLGTTTISLLHYKLLRLIT